MLTEEFMFAALRQAMLARDHGEVPVGAVIVKNSEIIGMGFNTVIKDQSVSSHAEINAINDAGRVLKNYRLLNCDLYVTLEPCHMCAKAIVDARIKKVIFAAPEPKTGSIISIDNFFNKSFLNHKPDYAHGILEQESGELLKNFFKNKR
jgi:tRNA(adenine34) deaminase